MSKITTLAQLQSLQQNTMIYAVIVFLVAVAIAFLVSGKIILYDPKGKSYVKRRVANIIIGIIACLAFYLYNDLYVKGFIMNAGFKRMFVKTNLQCIGITAGGYIIIGLILMLIFRNSKFGSILPKRSKEN